MSSSDHLSNPPRYISSHGLPSLNTVPPQYEPASELIGILRKLWRRKVIILFTTAILLAVALLVVRLMTPLYLATSEVLIGVPSSNAGNMAANGIEKMVVDRDTVESQGHVVHSRSVASRVVQRMALDLDPEFNPALRPKSTIAKLKSLFSFGDNKDNDKETTDSATIKQRNFERVVSVLLNDVEVEPAERSHVLEINARSQNPERASRIANAFADLYLEQSLIRKAETTQKANDWLSGQLQKLRQQVDQDERAVEDYRSAHGLYTTKMESVTQQQMGELNSQLVTAESAKAEADAQYNQATTMLRHGKDPKSIPQVLASPIIQALEEKKTDVEQKAAELSAIYGPKHPMIVNINAQISDIDAKIKQQISQIVASLKNEQIAAQARYSTLKATFDKSQTNVGLTNEQSIKLHQLEREAEASSQLFQNFLQGYKETSAQQNFQQPDAWVISHAGTPDSVDFPPKNAILLGALVAGLMLGGLLALFAESLDQTLHTAKSAEDATGLQTLALIPMIKARTAADYVLQNPGSAFAESVRKLHTRLALGHAEKPPTSIMLTSSVPDEGKSLISISMARLLAYTGRRVIVVDGDFRRPSLHTLLGQPTGLGLYDLLDGKATPDQTVYRDPESGLHAIFAGRVPSGQAYVPDFERMRALMASLARHYDLVVLDTPPILVGSETLHYANLVDTTVFVARWRHTSQEIISDAIQQLRGTGGDIAGVALAQVVPSEYKRYASVDLHYSYARGSIAARMA